jgi:ribonucleoside-diphosphate reductase alpha chain
LTGPKLNISEWIDVEKYRQPGESHKEKCTRIADVLSDNPEHFEAFRDILLHQRFLPAGRVQSAIGAAREVTPYNCFVSGTIPDSMGGIMNAATEAAETMRLGGGIGYDFSTLRPRGDLISRTGSPSSGPVSFMRIFDAVCATVASAGHRRGAQMGVLRVDHPDVEEFIRAKQNSNQLTQFNVSLGITDAFMIAVDANQPFELVFQGKVYKTISARNLWNEIMRSTWDWAEPGVLFIDTINNYNNLYYCETIAATNPCAEQPLPPHGACLLGSFNLVKYLVERPVKEVGSTYKFDFETFKKDIINVVRAMDNVVDVAIYPLAQQKEEAKSKRRMGLGVTGLANCIETIGYKYGSEVFLALTRQILETLRDTCYETSSDLAKEKGSFPLLNKQDYLDGYFISRLPKTILDKIAEQGIRNSHLTSIAPTGTISLVADNVSSGIEPVYSVHQKRIIQTFNGPLIEEFDDYAWTNFGTVPKTANECTVEEHLAVLLVASKYMDSAVSKTCNVGDNVSFTDFKKVYMDAWTGGAKGCTTFRAAGKRMGILSEAKPVQQEAKQEEEISACYFDPETGVKTCE